MRISLPILYGANLKAYKSHAPEVMLSGPADTGKTITQLTKLHYLAHKYADASFVIARKQQTDTYSTVLVSFQDKILQDDPTVTSYGGEKPQWYEYPTGSRIWITGLDKSGKVLSGEHDLIYVNQAEEISLADWETLTTRTTGRAGHISHPQTIGDCNPSSPAHWIRQRARQGHLAFFESTHQDNPDLFDQRTGEQTQEGVRRLGNLQRLTGSRFSRLFLGLWSAPEGMIYEHFDEAFHKIKSVELPAFWPRVVGIDPVGAQIAAVWLAYDPRNQVIHVYREYMQPFGETTPQHVRHVENMSKGEMIMAWVGGGPSERQQRMDWGGILEPGITDVWSGIDRINSLLREKGLFIHDCCVNLLSEIGQYQRVIGKDGIATDKILDKEKFHCLVGDTHITTSQGDIPIRDVEPEMHALTRRGWRRVLKSACTNPAAIVYRIEFSNGDTLRGTGEHLIYIADVGWESLRSLRYDDIMVTSKEVLSWRQKHAESERRSGSMDTSGGAIQTQRLTALAMSILQHSLNCMYTYGKCIMGQCRKAITYIISTATKQTTTLKTWSVYQQATIPDSMLYKTDLAPRFPQRSTPAIWRTNGTHRRRGENGIENTARKRGRNECLLLGHALNATASSNQKTTEQVRDFVLTNAGQRRGEIQELTTNQESVSIAEKCFIPTSTQKQDFVPVYVLSVTEEAQPQAVYNLEIEDMPEYFANGVLVHNCLDSLRYAIAWLSRPQEQIGTVQIPLVPIGAEF